MLISFCLQIQSFLYIKKVGLSLASQIMQLESSYLLPELNLKRFKFKNVSTTYHFWQWNVIIIVWLIKRQKLIP